MTKKTLIELMLENNVQWPEGAEFAVQDKSNLNVYFYRIKPTFTGGKDKWGNYGVIMGSGIKLPELCHGWHCTIVTREQYEMAYADKACKAVVEPIIKSAIQECLLVSIIDKIAHHQSESQRHEEAMLDHNDKELALRDQLNEMLAKVGMKVVDNTLSAGTIIKTTGEELHTKHPKYEVVKPSQWPDYCDENGIVVDWDRVPEGSEVECVGRDGSYLFKEGGVYVVGNDECGDYGPLYDENHAPTKSAIKLYKFRLIR